MEEPGREPCSPSLWPQECAQPQSRPLWYQALNDARLPHDCGCGPLGPSAEQSGSVVSEPRSAPASLSASDPHPAGSCASGASEPVGQLGLSLLELGAEEPVRLQAYLCLPKLGSPWSLQGGCGGPGGRTGPNRGRDSPRDGAPLAHRGPPIGPPPWPSSGTLLARL